MKIALRCFCFMALNILSNATKLIQLLVCNNYNIIIILDKSNIED